MIVIKISDDGVALLPNGLFISERLYNSDGIDGFLFGTFFIAIKI